MACVRPYAVLVGGRRSSRRIRSGDVGQEAMEVDDEHITPAREETGIKLRAACALVKNLIVTAPRAPPVPCARAPRAADHPSGVADPREAPPTKRYRRSADRYSPGGGTDEAADQGAAAALADRQFRIKCAAAARVTLEKRHEEGVKKGQAVPEHPPLCGRWRRCLASSTTSPSSTTPKSIAQTRGSMSTS